MTEKVKSTTLQLTESELAELKENAKKMGMKQSTYIRHMTIYNVREGK